MKSENIGFAFREISDSYPDRNAIIAEDFNITFGNLWRVTERFALKFRSNDVGQTSVVGIDTRDMIVSVSSLLALSMLGAGYVIIGADFDKNADIGLTHFFKSPERAGLPELSYIDMDAAWSPQVPWPDAGELDAHGFSDPTATGWILQTSGTTGRPKSMNIDVETVWKRVQLAGQDFAEQDTRVAMLFGCNSRPFAIRAIAALLRGATIIDSQNFYFLLSQKATLLCGSPIQIQHWLSTQSPSSRLPRLQVSGSKLSKQMIADFLKHFDIVEDVYGSGETIAAEVTRYRFDAKDITATRRDVGNVVEIVDNQDHIMPRGQKGRVRIQSTCMVRGYIANPNATKAAFRNGCFYPGDLGVRDQNGLLQIVGREDDVINWGGVKFNLADLDFAMTSTPSVNVACAFEVDGELVAVVQPSSGVEFGSAAKDARAACVAARGAEISPSQILIVDDAPVTADGTPQRRTCTALYFQHMAGQGDKNDEQRLFFGIDFDD